MKYKPYQEIMDFDKERKEYVELCKYKSKNSTYYTDWEEHISKCISTINNERDLYNFKRYCIRRKRTTAKMPDLQISVMGVLITFIIDKILGEFRFCLSEMLYGIISAILFAICIIVFIIIIVTQHNDATIESHFFEDIIEIIEKVESERSGNGCKDI